MCGVGFSMWPWIENGLFLILHCLCPPSSPGCLVERIHVLVPCRPTFPTILWAIFFLSVIKPKKAPRRWMHLLVPWKGVGVWCVTPVADVICNAGFQLNTFPFYVMWLFSIRKPGTHSISRIVTPSIISAIPLHSNSGPCRYLYKCYGLYQNLRPVQT
jgi:hypothetical protein